MRKNYNANYLHVWIVANRERFAQAGICRQAEVGKRPRERRLWCEREYWMDLSRAKCQYRMVGTLLSLSFAVYVSGCDMAVVHVPPREDAAKPYGVRRASFGPRGGPPAAGAPEAAHHAGGRNAG